MFKTIEIENFKGLGSFSKPLGVLTLFTGQNAAGKSSVIQTLALLRQTAVEHEWSKELHLNGSSVQLGTMFDVIDRNSGGTGFRLKLSNGTCACEWETSSQDRKRDLVAKISRISVLHDGIDTIWNKEDLEKTSMRRLVPHQPDQSLCAVLEEIQEQLASICHISAERLGPREVYVAQTPLFYPEVGAFGEKTPWCLEQFADSDINPGLVLPGMPPFVRLTVQAWMSQLFPGFQLELKRVDAANLITMGIRTTPRGDFFRPANVGFGISHVLPIITACVAARPGRLVIVENPETHLHPAGQSLIGYFLAMSATEGVQVIVETHSDHVLNGMRRAVRDQKLSADEVKIFFFRGETNDEGETRTIVDDVIIERGGRLRGWPTGFFDQLESDLDYIFRA